MTATEREILEVLWQEDKPVTQSHLLKVFNERGRFWKRQTLNTFVTRLEYQGLIVREYRKVRPAFTEEGYKFKVIMDMMIASQHEGRVNSCIGALLDKGFFGKEDLEETRKILLQNLANEK